MSDTSESLTIRLSPDLRRALKEHAAQEDRPESQIVRRAIAKEVGWGPVVKAKPRNERRDGARGHEIYKVGQGNGGIVLYGCQNCTERGAKNVMEAGTCTNTSK